MRALGVALACVAATHGVRAQDAARAPRFGLTAGAGATYGNLIGGDFEGTKAAAGFVVNGGVILRRWELDVAYDRTNHGHEETSGDYTVSNVFLDTRLTFPSTMRPWAPYASVRLGRAQASFDGMLGLTDKATGWMGGVGAGLLVPVASRVQADIAGAYDRLSHDYGTGDYSAAEKGGRASVRVGLRVRSAR